MIFRQLFDRETSTYTYLVGDPLTREMIIIDPVREQFDRDRQLVRELEGRLKMVLETHIHADHVTAAARWRSETGAVIGVAAAAEAKGVDLPLQDGQEIKVGSLRLKVLATPGHTNSCLSYYLADRVFTGDALTIRGCGRTDFQQGSSETLFASVNEKLYALPDATFVYPAHDYRGLAVSTIAEEKRFNPRLPEGRELNDFVKIMRELKLALPQRIDEAVPANLCLGAETTVFQDGSRPRSKGP